MMRTRYGIRKYVAWLTLAPLLIMAISMEVFFLQDRFKDLNRDLLVRGNLIAHQLASSSEYGVYSNNQLFLKNIAQGVLMQADVSGVIIQNAAGVPLVEVHNVTGGKERDAALPERGDANEIVLPSAASVTKMSALVNSQSPIHNSSDSLLIYQPINSTQVALDELEARPAVTQLGAVIVKMGWAHTQKLKQRLLLVTVLPTLLFLVITFYAVYRGSRRITYPIGKLSDAVHAIGSGNLGTRVVVSSDISELHTLAQGINDMAAQLQHERGILQQRIDEATLQLRTLAFYDTLTKLPNRRMLEDRLAQAISASSRTGRFGALMFLDLDNFKPLNDKYGHAVGDLLLVEAAQRISNCMRAMDTVARFGGDEFVVMISELDVDKTESIKQVGIIAEKIRMALGEAYVLRYQTEGKAEAVIEHHCTSSIGVALFLNDETGQNDILTRADLAMYQAKAEGRNRISFYQAPT
ncbi:diguanylate cyclase domain-containing protein [Sulfuriferula thiophila]|uniref:diguanylate cyclase domain-containing protein n=1 Tax=Sulfuriferula thiophila TaxID=1781211 RepID=UPI000F6050EC|nr:diguanylate cyclase [Sulfuriferula thiophila]